MQPVTPAPMNRPTAEAAAAPHGEGSQHPEPAASGPHPLWEGGWLHAARWHPSPHFGPRPDGAEIDLVVVHSISLPPGQYGTGQVDRLFAGTLDWEAHPYFQAIRGLEVSAHFFIDRQGGLTQYVSVFDRAWHAGVSCWRGRSNCNNDSVGVELEGLEGDTFEPAQYARLAWLCEALHTACPIRHVAGHEHIAPGRKQDPGPGFDWPRLRQALGWPADQFAA